ncbi:COQ9 family protein [Kordiimonas gwangyangensis]|uniref:COQ9 family protein n=1 Tax=Kordiimonas gwangyangensis TaxID=288022 RepID=UPI00037D04B1|nr:COQ9 family protein [Kordiimonas gwangyangensis]
MTTDKTPLELRVPLIEAMLSHVPFDGWSQKALENAAADLDVSPEMAELAFPGGAMEAMETHLVLADEKLAETLASLNLMDMRIRDRITLAVRTRIEQAGKHREAVKRGVAVHALPQNVAAGMKAGWRTCDTIWRACGDTSTDHNWYTKRASLLAVYSSTLLFWLNDESEGFEDTWAFLDRRIENVMTFEKTKFKMREACAKAPSLSNFISRLRYPHA